MKPTRPAQRALKLSLVMLVMALLVSACGTQPTPAPLPTPTQPANDDLARVRAAGVLKVGTSGDYAPFASYNQSFQLDGMDIALMRELGRRLGVRVDFQDFAFDGVLDAMRLGQVDAVAAALTVTDQRLQVADFTNYYYVGADGVIARSDSNVTPVRTAQDLIGRKVGVQRGSVYETWIRQTLIDTNQLPAANLFSYTNSDDAVRDLRDRRIDVVVLDLIPAQRYTAPGSQFRLVGQQLNTQRLAVAVRKGSTLRSALDEALLAAQNDGTVNRLLQQYLGVSGGVTPPILPTATPGIFPIITPNPPTTCVDGMSFIADLNYDDQNMTNPPLLNPGQPFVKGWRVRNSGTCAWTTAYRFDYAGGNSSASLMNGQPQALGRVVNPGEVVDFQVSLVAPLAAGTYQGFWQMRNGASRNFGTRVWVGIRVPGFSPPTPAPGSNIFFTADRTQISPGQPVVFNWQVRNAQSVVFYAEGDFNAQRNNVQFNGSTTVYPQVSTTYSLRVVQLNGTTEIRQIAIIVSQAPNAPTINRFDVVPNQINLGQCVTISWQTSGQVNRVRILRNNAPLWDGAPITGSTQDCPQVSGQNTYTLEAYGPSASTRAQRNLFVNQGGGGGGNPNIESFFVSPDQIQAGGCVQITWDTSNAIQVRVTRNGNIRLDSGQLDGSAVDCLQQPGFYGYRLEVYSASGGSAVRERAVTVYRGDQSSSSRGPTPMP
jgi:ABC-type amino acid transport substrate-binding protein